MTLTDEPRSVIALEMADRMLAEVASVDDAQKIINLAEMARVYARQSKLGTSAINHATVIKIRAERKLADVVDEGQQSGQIATPANGPSFRTSSQPAQVPSTLPEIGVESARLAEARLFRDTYTDETLAERQAEANERDEVLSRQQLLAEARSANNRNAAIQKERVGLLFPVFDALDVLAAVDMPAAEWVKHVPAYSAYRVANRLDAASTWLAELKEAWSVS